MMRRVSAVVIAGSLVTVAGLGPGMVGASAASPPTTKTTITSSAPSSTYDAPVTFTAHVNSGAGIPQGSVSFLDRSNGSTLDTTALTSGEATFTTAALAVGSRAIVAEYSGSGGFTASNSAAADLAVAAAGVDAVTYQEDARHDGDQPTSGLTVKSLHQLWNVSLGVATGYIEEAGDVSYPVIAGGRVFVVVENSESYGDVLYALSASTGATDWSVGLDGTYGFSALAYDGEDLFVVNFNGVLTAFNSSSGLELWSEQLPGQYSFTAPPTAYDGVIYVSGAGSGGTLYAVSEADGVVRWTASVENGDKSSPAVDNTGVYVSYACQQDYHFKLNGALVWHHTSACEGGGGSTAVLHGTSLYARGSVGLDTPISLSKAAGAPVGSFASRTAPAFGDSDMYTTDAGNLVAVNPSGSPDIWSFGDGTLVTAPVVGGSVVFVGSSNGTVYGVAARTGKQVWSASAGPTILAPDEQNADVLVGIAIGDGMLVVPAGNELTAFGN
jgi:outer membrane protein assembly factor BamB